MALFTSLMHEKFRKNFFVFLFLSSTFPLLLLIFIIYQHVIPVIMPDQINGLRVTFTYGGQDMPYLLFVQKTDLFYVKAHKMRYYYMVFFIAIWRNS